MSLPAPLPVRSRLTAAPWSLAAGLLLSFGLSATLGVLYGRQLVEALLPLAAQVIGLMDDRFTVLSLTIERDKQDTVVKLVCNLVRYLAIGSRVVEPSPSGWLAATTTVGAVLQPLVVAVGLAGAWPGRWSQRLLRLPLAVALGLLFTLVDLPLTLHAYIWDMFVDFYEPQRLSPLLWIHAFLNSGGRLAAGVVLGGLAIGGAARLATALAGRTANRGTRPAPGAPG